MTSLDETSTRLLASSSKHSYDPALDIDWDAPLDAGLAYLPPERVSLYGTALWAQLSDAQRHELAKHELASIAGTGLWFETILIHLFARYVYHQDPQSPRAQYALTEIGDETRHVIMFANAIKALDVPTYRPRPYIRRLARLYKATAKGAALFAPLLVAEEVTDRLQRATMNDESINALVRMVNRIHVVEEARHVRFARTELARLVPTLGPVTKLVSDTASAVVAAFIVHSLISPDVYAAVGLDPEQAVKQARSNPYHHQTRRWMGEKVMAFLDEQGMVTWASRPIYKLVHLL